VSSSTSAACLVAPGSSERMLAKAREIDAGEIVIDLEDAVVPERKDEARELALAALAAGGFTAPAVSVRVNAPGTPWAHLDLIALGSAERRPDSVVIPKVQSAGDLAFVARLLDGTERATGREHPLPVQALVETASGVRALDQIAAATPRLVAIIVGYADLAVSLGRSPQGAADLDRWIAVQDAVLASARAAGLRAVDGPYLAIDDRDGLRASANRGAELGFDAKWAIHPAQLEIIAGAFIPGDEEVARAEAVLAALASASSAHGAISLNGEMLDEPVRLAALRTLARAGRGPERAR
jgi:citrate lyase subunit beta/citryl-CoA lyase